RDDRCAGPVEAIDQRSADGLYKRLEGDAVASQRAARIEELVDGPGVVISGAIFSLHEPVGAEEAEERQLVLDAAADEPPVLTERLGVKARRQARRGAEQRGAGPVGSTIAAIDIGIDGRSHEVT